MLHHYDFETYVKTLYKRCVIHGDFTLRSGRKSSWYFDKNRMAGDPLLLADTAILIDEQAKQYENHLHETVDAVAGMELGGAIIAAVASTVPRTRRPALYVRSKPKEYGTKNRVEGWITPKLRPAGTTNVLLVEDVTTTGGAVLDAAEALKEAGYNVCAIVAVLDRGGGYYITEAGYAYAALVTQNYLMEMQDKPSQ